MLRWWMVDSVVRLFGWIGRLVGRWVGRWLIRRSSRVAIVLGNRASDSGHRQRDIGDETTTGPERKETGE